MKEEQKVKIETQDHYGRGVTHEAGNVTFVKGMLQEEEGTIEIIKETKHYRIAHLKELLTVSKKRCVPPCPYYEKCGGCQVMHQKYEEQCRFKTNKVKAILYKFARVDDRVIKDIVAGEPLYYRNKLTLHIELDQLGFYEEESHKLLPIADCLLLDRNLLPVLERLKTFIKTEKNLTEAMIRLGNNTKEILLLVKGSCDESYLKEHFQGEVTTLVYNQKIVIGPSAIKAKIKNQTFLVSAPSFFQVNTHQTEVLYQQIIDLVKNSKPETVLDLYCGTGTITLLVSPYAKEVIGIEVVKEAIKDAKRNQRLNQIANVHFINGTASEACQKIKKSDLVIVDPPRKGLEKKVRNRIVALAPKHIIYVSCDPVTLARDLAFFRNAYQVELVQPVDMFPNTYHVECICLLNRR